MIVAEDEEPVTLIPPVVDPVDVQVDTVLVGIDIGNVPVAIALELRAAILYSMPSVPLPIDYSLGCIDFRVIETRQHTAPSIFMFRCVTRALPKGVPFGILA